MSLNSRSFSGRAVAVLLVAAGIGWLWARPEPSKPSSDSKIHVKDVLESRPRPESGPADAALAADRARLLDLAFDAATSLPVRPHLKDRSRAQEDVVTAWLELRQPQRALAGAHRIENWRRGACYADYAFYCAQAGHTEGIEEHLERASKIADDHAKLEASQDWHRDRIRAKIARTWLLLGKPDRAAPYATGVVESEAGGFAALAARLADPASADSRLATMDDVFAKGDVDQIRNALDACVQMYGAFWGHTERRARIEAKVLAGYRKLPPELGIDAIVRLAKTASAKEDPKKALELLKVARGLLEGARWLPEDRIRITARLAVVRHESGERGPARESLDALLAGYAYEREKIVDIYRAGALRAIAEAYQAVGESKAALDVYKRAVEEGVGNPNSRPRAEDLVATCLSMARARVEPDAALWTRLQEVRRGLGDPW
jgi:tetratricopeptide (TPR) repeat protein